MAEKNNGKKIVEIKENPNPAKKPEGNPAENDQPKEGEDVKYTFGYCLRHPIKAYKHAAEEHPVATGVTSGGAILGLAFLGKVIIDAFTGGETAETVEEDDELDDVLEDEDEDDEDEI